MPKAILSKSFIGASRSQAYYHRPGVKKVYEKCSRKAKKREKAAGRRLEKKLERAFAEEDSGAAQSTTVNAGDDMRMGNNNCPEEARHNKESGPVGAISEGFHGLVAAQQGDAALTTSPSLFVEFDHSAGMDRRQLPSQRRGWLDIGSQSSRWRSPTMDDRTDPSLATGSRTSRDIASSAYLNWQMAQFQPGDGHTAAAAKHRADMNMLVDMFHSSHPFCRTVGERVFNITELCCAILDELDTPELLRMRAVNGDIFHAMRTTDGYGERTFLKTCQVQRTWIGDLEDRALHKTCCYTDPAPFMTPSSPIGVILPPRLNPVIFERPPLAPVHHWDSKPTSGIGSIRCIPCESRRGCHGWKTGLRFRQVQPNFCDLIDDMLLTQPPTTIADFEWTVMALEGTAAITKSVRLQNERGLRYHDLRTYLSRAGYQDPSVLMHLLFIPKDNRNVTFPPDCLSDLVDKDGALQCSDWTLECARNRRDMPTVGELGDDFGVLGFGIDEDAK